MKNDTKTNLKEMIELIQKQELLLFSERFCMGYRNAAKTGCICIN